MTSKPAAQWNFTDSELLALAREGIAKLIAGNVQSYTIGPMSFTLPDLPKLQQFADEYQRRVDSSRGIPQNVVQFNRR